MTTVDGSLRPAARVLHSDDEAVAAAHELAAVWRELGPLRDQDRAVPRTELALLARSGLLAMTVPKRFGGPGLGTGTLTRVFAILSAADAALAQVPQNHFGALYGLDLEDDDDERKAFFLAEAIAGARFGNAGHERGKGGRSLPKTTIVDDGDGYRINGSKSFCTGALTAQWVPVSAAHPDGWLATAILPQGTPGLVILEDWDAFGQRATVSGSAELTDSWVPSRYVFNQSGRRKPDTAFRYTRSQLTHAAIQLGIAEEVLARADRLDTGTLAPAVAGRFRAWRDDLELEIAATAALVARAAALIDEVVAAGRATADSALGVGIAVDEAKCLAYDLGPAATDGFVEFLDAGYTDAEPGFDRHWRNARTHSLHDPIRWRRHYVGDFHLNGTPPPFMKWLLESAGDAPL
ncbi:SfnB family sulfur acquisition oxidoreductase [Dactylosporangium fulvum]|uniref:Acyl-CoA dehydrogenase family protein n=1 Tax=Dactylosporangium fulvum TaxID=53359 RepID=A0ABY5W9V8_9ACTN|nr:acyl-CoA dehydrogenase family protein [Dactylosporangium fulvum]UWP86830.1 acyl-CoA dehydrogenase family protein [Dactylosporangium fulvum]